MIPNKRFPYLISCPIPTFKGNAPTSVSLTVGECDQATNNLEIIDNQPTDGAKKEFGVCLEHFADNSDNNFIIKFIEWVHLQRILGAEKVHLFNHIHQPRLSKILKYLEEKGLVEVQRFQEPSDIDYSDPNSFSTFVLELAMINDCFYRTKSLYKYVAIVDSDEVIMPKNENHKWHEVLLALAFLVCICCIFCLHPDDGNSPRRIRLLCQHHQVLSTLWGRKSRRSSMLQQNFESSQGKNRLQVEEVELRANRRERVNV
jgi:hypothetical protein